MKIRQGKGPSCQKNLKSQSIPSQFKNRAGQRPILSKESKNSMCSIPLQQLHRAKADFVKSQSTQTHPKNKERKRLIQSKGSMNSISPIPIQQLGKHSTKKCYIIGILTCFRRLLACSLYSSDTFYAVVFIFCK